MAVWGAGSVAWLAVGWRRVARFRRLLATAVLAPEPMQRQAEGLSRRLGLRLCPRLWMLPGPVSPMLWAFGVPRVLVSAEHWASIDEGQRRALLAHELAHLKRRDHWTRLVETAAAVLYWWHPVVWLARRQLRRAEERCCDAWAVWASPEGGRTYADALLAVVDYLSETRPVSPMGSSGLGLVSDLKGRLVMIMSGTTPRRLSNLSRLALLGLAALALPWLPAWGRQQPAAETKPKDGPAAQANPDVAAVLEAVYSATQRGPDAQAEPIRAAEAPAAGDDAAALRRQFALERKAMAEKELMEVRAELRRLYVDAAAREAGATSQVYTEASDEAVNRYVKDDPRTSDLQKRIEHDSDQIRQAMRTAANPDDPAVANLRKKLEAMRDEFQETRARIKAELEKRTAHQAQVKAKSADAEFAARLQAYRKMEQAAKAEIDRIESDVIAQGRKEGARAAARASSRPRAAAEEANDDGAGTADPARDRPRPTRRSVAIAEVRFDMARSELARGREVGDAEDDVVEHGRRRPRQGHGGGGPGRGGPRRAPGRRAGPRRAG